MPKAILLCGPPAAGKSTYAEAFKRTGCRVHSRDEVRERLRAIDAGVAEAVVWQTFVAEILESLRNGDDIVADATFSKRARRDEVITSIQRLHVAVDIELHWLRTPLQACLDRNERRVANKIPEADIRRLYDEIEAGLTVHPPSCRMVIL